MAPHPYSSEGVAAKFDAMPGPWVKRKRGYFYRPNNQGYTSRIEEAGHYPKEEAIAYAAESGGEVTCAPLEVYRADLVRNLEVAKAALESLDGVIAATKEQRQLDDAQAAKREWPHDKPSGWNLDAAKFTALVQTCPHMWLVLGRAKYIELRIDTRDGGFNLYDRDRDYLNPDDVVAAIKSAIEKFGEAPYRRTAS